MLGLRNAVGRSRVCVLNVMEKSVMKTCTSVALRSYEGVERDVSNVLKKALHNT